MVSCTICDDKITKTNPLFVCVGCKVSVHKQCYGAQGSPQKWKCSPCRSGKSGFAKCQLCLTKGGAMKQTKCNNWVHVICALFTNGVTISNCDSAMEPIDLSKVSASKRRCAFCYSSQGHGSLCSTSGCKERFHITCAQKQKTLVEDVNPIDNSIKFNAYCNAHKPKDTSRRLSSEAIRGVIDKKRTKALKTKSAKESADWILGGVKHHSTPVKPTILPQKRSGKKMIFYRKYRDK